MEKAVEFILSRFPIIRKSLDVNMYEIISGAVVAFMLKVLGVGLTFLFNLVLARTLGAEGVGLYFLALTVTTIATVFGRMGLDNTLLRFTAANAAVEDWKAVKGVYVKGMKLAFIASLISAILVFTLAPFLADTMFHKSELVSPMRWMAFAVMPMSLLILHAEMLKGLRRIKDSLVVFGVGVPAISLICLYLIGDSFGVNGAVWAYSLSAALIALLGFILWQVATPQIRKITGTFLTKELTQSSMPLLWAGILHILIQWTATITLGVWAAKDEIGIFSIALRTAMLTSLIMTSVNSIIVPKYAELYKKNEMKALDLTARKTAMLMTMLASPILLFFLLVPDLVMELFGAEYKKGGIILSILAIGQFVNVTTGSVAFLLMMSGNERFIRNGVAIVAIISVLLNIILVPYAGALGAAIATTICAILSNILNVYLVWLRLGILVMPFIWKGE